MVEKTSESTELVAVTTGVTEILKADPSRVAIIFSNMSASNVVLGAIRGISLTEGILLQSSGGSVTISTLEDGPSSKKRWFAIGAGAVNIYVTEVRKIEREPQTPGA